MPRGEKLKADGSNRKEFIEGLFTDKTWRHGVKGKITKALAADPPLAWMISEEERRTITTALKKGWSGGHASCPESDTEWMAFLKDYVSGNKLVMWIPKLEIAQSGSPATYGLLGYEPHDFGSGGTLDLLLDLFLAGAHFVVIHSAEDLGGAAKDFYKAMIGALSTSRPLGHSHYAGTSAGNPGSGAIFPSTPQGYPYIVALLADHTSRSDPNSFFQLEGWPLFASPYLSTDAASLMARDADRHLKTDFATHNETIWNISTYGACGFSEKRGTTVFLAPQEWAPFSSPNTPIMSPYRGSTTRQWWLKSNLITPKYARR